MLTWLVAEVEKVEQCVCRVGRGRRERGRHLEVKDQICRSYYAYVHVRFTTGCGREDKGWPDVVFNVKWYRGEGEGEGEGEG